MNQAQIHLALNHAPLFLSILSGLLLIISFIKKNELVRSLALWGMLAAALFTLPVYFTGEGTEEIVEKFGVNEKAIEEHEEFAGITMIIIAIAGMFALLALIFRNRLAGFSAILSKGLILLAFISFGAMAWTAHLGGLVRHNELSGARAGIQNTENGNAENTTEKPVNGEKEEKDDD
jgi:uncharacterized membrane protein